jgi:hypothetical protein
MFENALPEKARDVLEKIAPVIRKEKFYLAGGTGLALQIGHRLSGLSLGSGKGSCFLSLPFLICGLLWSLLKPFASSG